MTDISDEKIKWFRDVFNQKSFGYWKYSSFGGKNLFNPICSCMDWISVAIRSISGRTVYSDDIDVRVMEVFSLISSIDIVAESVKTLDTIIFGKMNRESPFKGEKRIFTNNNFSDDDEFFTQLRARFGAHPVNLKNDRHERLYASWPYESPLDGSDLEVLLYSNLPDKEPIKFGLKISELTEYLITRYDHLTILGNEVINQLNQTVKDFSEILIARDDNPLKQINILATEAKERMNNDFLVGELYELSELFTASLKDTPLANLEIDFKHELRPYIDELYDHLQRMDLDNPVSHPACYSLNLLQTIDDYTVGKYIVSLSDRFDDPLIDYYISVLNKLGEGEIIFDQNDPSSVSRLKLYLLNYKMQLNA